MYALTHTHTLCPCTLKLLDMSQENTHHAYFFIPFLYISHTLTHRDAHRRTFTEYMLHSTGPLWLANNIVSRLFCLYYTHTLRLANSGPSFPFYYTHSYYTFCTVCGTAARAPTYIPLPIIMHTLWSNPPGSGVGWQAPHCAWGPSR